MHAHVQNLQFVQKRLN